MPFAVGWMTRDIWQLVTSQGTDCTDDEYKLAEKLILRIGPAYEWPRRAILTLSGEPGSLKHNCVAGRSMGRFSFAVWCIGNGCTAELLKEWVATRKLISEPADLRSFNTLCDNLVAGRITEVGGRAVTFKRLACNQWRRQPLIEWRACLADDCTYPVEGSWCDECREGDYVLNHSRLTVNEYQMLDAPVQDYYKAQLLKWGVPFDLLIPIDANLSDALLGRHARGV